ncbi:helix-turn-helix transcriptional regulator [Chelativorans sp. YIM 93263]|uniref:helix-turn-helix transcriptional regulator n=1 Tax=Chelativorans sp. YIM 93263 TaxID=2906648 RepID=UPI002377E098|nr:LuxR family transcriptional regulator [Chelativorans sp. YIM 93263]
MDTETRERRKTAEPIGTEPARELSAFLARQTRELGANDYLLLDASGCILSSNWIYDAVAEVGLPNISQLARSSALTWPGQEIRGYHPLALSALTERDEIAALAYYGHQEVFVLALPTHKPRHLLLSAGKPGAVDKSKLSRAQMTCCYALSQLIPAGSEQSENPLNANEIDCLSWVSHGKTTDEVALILNVSTNMVNSQIAHAIHKLKAKNRAMAIAAAIRRNLI